jgi:PAS domain S-box-containing protein
MRKNLPITQREYALPDGMTIVSRTDLKGRITYVNPDFLTASGFDEEELIGQPHNLVRHPDMPEQAFADLWTTLQAGRPWTGLVKNRRKNGDHYWVLANATPLLENGATTGYLSVRTRPTREQVAAATATYQLFTSGQADGLAIHEGHVVRTGGLALLAAPWHALHHAPLGVKATLLGLGMVGTSAAAAGAVHLASLPLAGAAAAALLITLTAGAAFVRRLGQGLQQAARQLDNFSQGHFDTEVDARGQDQLSQAMLALKRVQTRLGFELADAQRRARDEAAQREAETRVAREVNDAITAATQGDLTVRIPLEGKTPFFSGLCDGVNHLLSTVGSTMADVRAAAQQLGAASGQVSQTSHSLSMSASQQAASVEQTAASLQQISAVGAPERRQRHHHRRHRHPGRAPGAGRWQRGGPDGGGDEVHRHQDLHHRRHRLPDQPAGAERRHRGRTRRRTRQGLRRRGRRGAQAGRTQPGRRAGDQQLAGSSVNLAETAGGLLARMVPSIQRTGELVQEIAAASGEQSDGVTQITGAMNHLSSATQQTASASEQLSATAEQLSAQAMQLQDLMAAFRLQGDPGTSIPLSHS